MSATTTTTTTKDREAKRLVATIRNHGVTAWTEGETLYAVETVHHKDTGWTSDIITLPVDKQAVREWLGY